MTSKKQDEEEFNFFFKFIKTLVLQWPDQQERVTAASWLQKLQAEKDPNKNDYLKLLLFVLHRKKLIGMFANNPEPDSPLPPLPEGIDLVSLAWQLMESELEAGASGEPPPYTVEVSADLKEYAVAQNIPNFGTHCYYAVSKQPITEWCQSQFGMFPQGPRNFAVNVFDTTTPSVPAIPERTFPDLDKLEEGLNMSGQARSTCGGSDKSFIWLERIEHMEDTSVSPGKCKEKSPEDWNAFAGYDEIEQQLQEFYSDLNEVKNPGTTSRMSHKRDDGGDLIETMAIINSGGGPAMRATTQMIQASESNIAISQTHSITTIDPVDHSLLRIDKAMRIQEQFSDRSSPSCWSQSVKMDYDSSPLEDYDYDYLQSSEMAPETEWESPSLPSVVPYESGSPSTEMLDDFGELTDEEYTPPQRVVEKYTPSSPVKHQSYHTRKPNRDTRLDIYEWRSNVPMDLQSEFLLDDSPQRQRRGTYPYLGDAVDSSGRDWNRSLPTGCPAIQDRTRDTSRHSRSPRSSRRRSQSRSHGKCPASVTGSEEANYYYYNQ